jgi:hypothetical protein
MHERTFFEKNCRKSAPPPAGRSFVLAHAVFYTSGKGSNDPRAGNASFFRSIASSGYVAAWKFSLCRPTSAIGSQVIDLSCRYEKQVTLRGEGRQARFCRCP